MIDSIIDFFRILFLSEVVLLTPSGIHIESELTLEPTSAIVAITKGASIEIDIPDLLNDKVPNINDIYKLIPPSSVSALLYQERGGEPIELKYEKGIYSKGRGSITIILANPDDMLTRVSFSKIVIKTRIVLNNVRVNWLNSKK